MDYRAKGRSDRFNKGSYNFICDICGFKFKRKDGRINYNGSLVCKDDFEIRQKQDFVRNMANLQTVDNARPDNSSDIMPDIFLDVGDVTKDQL